ncbi:MAG: hypothetical protein ACFCAD_20280 [Pleurocapsa sp.]
MNLSLSSFLARKSTNQILFIVLFLETVALALAISGAIAAGHSSKAYFEEGGYMTILSCLQLLGGAFVAKKVFTIAKNASNPVLSKSSLFWRTVYLGLSFLTFDDAFQIHEYMDKFIHLLMKILFGLEETKISDLADDLIVGGYLLLFLIYVAKEWQTIKVFRDSFIYFKVGFILTVVMIFFDAVSNNTLFVSMVTDNPQQIKSWLIWFGTLEDSVKVYAGGLFLVGIYKCWRIAKLQTKNYKINEPQKI